MNEKPDQISAQWLTNRLRRNGHLSQGEVVSVNIKARHKHHFALEVTYSAGGARHQGLRP
jgi:hypothetical protein